MGRILGKGRQLKRQRVRQRPKWPLSLREDCFLVTVRGVAHAARSGTDDDGGRTARLLTPNLQVASTTSVLETRSQPHLNATQLNLKGSCE